MWAKAVKWKVGLKLLTHTHKLLIPTQTRGTDVNILVNIKHWQPSEAMWDCEPPECWLQSDGTCCSCCMVAAILRSFIISAFNVCGKRHKVFRLRMSQATVVSLLWTDWHVFPLWIWNPRPWPKRSSQASAVPIRLELGNPQTAFETNLHVCQSWVEFGSANRIALETRYLF